MWILERKKIVLFSNRNTRKRNSNSEEKHYPKHQYDKKCFFFIKNFVVRKHNYLNWHFFAGIARLDIHTHSNDSKRIYHLCETFKEKILIFFNKSASERRRSDTQQILQQRNENIRTPLTFPTAYKLVFFRNETHQNHSRERKKGTYMF